MTTDLDPTGRFGDRAGDYDRYRPGYPPELVGVLDELGVSPPAAVADLGSGTGIFSAMLLDAGYRVYAVEPNAAMRERAEAALGGRDRFTSVDGTAEATGLARTVEAITCAQSFHWFDAGACRGELSRIGGTAAIVGLIWNDRRPEASALMAGYEALLERYGTDFLATADRYAQTQRSAIDFLGGEVRRFDGQIAQRLDADGLVGRFFSSSFTPAAGAPERREATAALRELFERHQEGGEVEMVYRTRGYFGRLTSG